MFTSLMSNRLYTTYEDTPSQGPGTSAVSIGRNLSPVLWKHVGGNGMTPTGLDGGSGLFDDFNAYHTAAAAGACGQWAFDEANAATAASLLTEKGGVLRLASVGTDNDGGGIFGGSMFQIDGDLSASTSTKVIFEARIRKSIAAASSVFVGLTKYDVTTVDGVLADGGTMVDDDFIGFQVTEAAPTTLVFTYKADGATQQTPISYSTALNASDYVKVGFAFLPSAKTGERLQVSVDNQVLGSVAQSSIFTTSAVSTFPDTIAMRPVAAVKSHTAAANTLDLDWVACWQED